MPESLALNLNWQEKRLEVRLNSNKGTYLRSSLRCLDNNDVLLLLKSILQSSKVGTQKVNAARGLRAVQDHLMYEFGYINFEQAYHLYSSFSHFFFFGPDKQACRDKLLDGIHSLPLYVITQPITCKIFAVLKNSSDMEKFLVDLTSPPPRR